MSNIIDLRSDTVTKPSDAMRRAMVAATVGDDVYGEDPTVNKLEELTAELLGTEAGIYVSSGTQSNLLAVLTQCTRGDEFIVGQKSHIFIYEGGAPVLGSIQPHPIPFEDDGTLNLDQVGHIIRPSDFHFIRTKMFCLENTQDGCALPLDYLPKAAELAKSLGLRLHLDGARIFNASVKQNVDVKEISENFHTISVCLSKGLGAPVGSVLCGSNEIVQEARRWRKLLGGGMRQAGIIAAAGIHALENNIERLAEDHTNAETLAKGLQDVSELGKVYYRDTQTNMVFVDVPEDHQITLPEFLKEKGILTHPNGTLRLVTHLDINANDVQNAIDAFKAYFTK